MPLLYPQIGTVAVEEIQEEPQQQQTEPVIYQGSGVGFEGAGIGGKKRAAKAVPNAAFQPGGFCKHVR